MPLRFVTGLLLGCVTALAVSELLRSGIVDVDAAWAQAVRFGREELRGALWLFLGVLALYAVQLQALLSSLRSEATPLEQIVRRDQLLDLCAALFFGIGVIWTAIGMRAALVQALDRNAFVDADSVDLLARLVDGGILLALSTTIVGGIGGYLMRAIKALVVGGPMNAALLRHTQTERQQTLDALRRVEEAVALDRQPREAE